MPGINVIRLVAVIPGSFLLSAPVTAVRLRGARDLGLKPGPDPDLCVFVDEVIEERLDIVDDRLLDPFQSASDPIRSLARRSAMRWTCVAVSFTRPYVSCRAGFTVRLAML